MGSVDNANPWPRPTYDTYRDCSQGICSIYCPQWCYILYPPPPPSSALSDDDHFDDDDSSSFEFSPLIVAIIGILTSAFILVTYYTIISKYCRRRRGDQISMELDGNGDEPNHESSQTSSSGLDEALIKSIKVCKYKKNDGLVQITDCSVCLSQFQENESLRLLPKCNHAFHLPCIDTWLKSHSSCPLCRSNIASNQTDSIIVQSQSVNVSSVMEYQHRYRDDAIIVVQILEGNLPQETGHGIIDSDVPPKAPTQEFGCDDWERFRANREVRQEQIDQPFKRSVSLNSCLGEEHVDVMGNAIEDEPFGASRRTEGSQNKESRRSQQGIKRSSSTAREQLYSPEQSRPNSSIQVTPL